MTFIEFANIIAENKGNAYYVGGKVRDSFMNRISHDTDIVITGMTKKNFENIFPEAIMTGKSFPVYRLKIEDEDVEIAFARTEKKTGTGHNGFTVDFSHEITIEEDLSRRDLTINAIAVHILDNSIVDPFNGRKDIADKKIAAVNEHFLDDPLRALRAARQATVFDFTITDETYKLMRACKEELKEMSLDRTFGEFKKALTADKPSMFFRYLQKADILDVTFPFIYKLIGKTQPIAFHPEGDAFEHTMIVLDAIANKTDNLIVRFCALMHDVGKGETPEEMLPHHYSHDKIGSEIIDALPSVYYTKWKKAASIVAKRHMAAHGMTKISKILKLLEDIRRTSISVIDFQNILIADNGAEHWFLKQEVFNEVFDTKFDIPKDKTGKQIGDFIFNQRVKILERIKKDLD